LLYEIDELNIVELVVINNLLVMPKALSARRLASMEVLSRGIDKNG